MNSLLVALDAIQSLPARWRSLWITDREAGLTSIVNSTKYRYTALLLPFLILFGA